MMFCTSREIKNPKLRLKGTLIFGAVSLAAYVVFT